MEMEDINDVQNLDVVGEGKQYIVVRLGNEQYGIDINMWIILYVSRELQVFRRHSIILKGYQSSW